MAPEIKLRKAYDGHKADLFSVGVILFILARGHFPFQEALSSDKYYHSLMDG
jgi:serine/threonine protein kinase